MTVHLFDAISLPNSLLDVSMQVELSHEFSLRDHSSGCNNTEQMIPNPCHATRSAWSLFVKTLHMIAASL